MSSLAKVFPILSWVPGYDRADIRSDIAGEFETMHIPGSYNVPLDTLGEHVHDLADVEHPVVLVCQTGGRATQARDKLADAGKHTLHILEGGMASWQASGGDVVHSCDIAGVLADLNRTTG